MATTLSIGQQVILTVAFEDAAGNPAQPPGAVSWASGTQATASVTVGVPDTSATVVSLAEGDTEITASSGGITATYDIEVTGGPATQATITAGTPTDSEGVTLPASKTRPR
jgi:hypothetical protein